MSVARDAAGLIAAVGAVLGAVSVAAGAFGAHALADTVTPERLDTFRTGASYGLAHSAAAVLAALSQARFGRWAAVAGWLFIAGVVVFSGSLYFLVLLDLPVLGAITPLGGVSMIAGWLALGHAAFWGARGK
jgi:uncharacterized membrane protein YgdD (TMEM256/DUF423 family)